MGICGSSNVAEAALSRQIDTLVEKDHDKEKLKIKLLLLGAAGRCGLGPPLAWRSIAHAQCYSFAGAGESGKSTIFKQMRILYGKGYSDEDRRGFKPVIFSNTLLSMKTLISQADEMGFAVEATVR